jgi:hypothetical protein
MTRRPIILDNLLLPKREHRTKAVADTVVIITAFSETEFGSELRQRSWCLHDSVTVC